MSQAGLFAAEPRVLAEDGEGGIRYWPRFVDLMLATRWFDSLRAEVDWHGGSRPMYDRVVDIPRLTAGFPLDGSKPLPMALDDAARAVGEGLGVAFTHVGMNHYRDGRDSVAPHNDKLDSLVPGHPIALLSLGATRRMDIREKQPSGMPPRRRGWRLELDAGSLLVMSHASQTRYDHGIPKTTAAVGPRISLAFRVRPQGGRW
ncbi:alpha-ketoglutarate-dependent dioxygenase AlkB [Cognatiluteimonas profundi]|uniref:alpha-ketoglutarate-dependent dioxygenase AlkB n=1 Tax=Cognatiluteimonas profundi TaxID=2594501 RepID=UPI00131BFED1|nr:alpha-ketoglutarate-dependent dioxygenase AlkB [Lysobacter profundi]